MASSNTGLIVGIVVGFLATLGFAFGIIYAAAIGLLPLIGPGLVPASIASTFPGATPFPTMQLYMVYNDGLLNILAVYILAPVVWLIGGLISGLIIAVAAVAASIGIGYTGSSLIGATAERAETFSSNVISVVLSEALAIYGLLIAFIIIGQI